MKKAKISPERDEAVDRIRELEAAIDRLQSERGSDRVELTVCDATIDAARARIAALERTCVNLRQRIAMAERERDMRRAESDAVALAREATARKHLEHESTLRDELASVRERYELEVKSLRDELAIAAAAADREIYEARAERDRFAADLQEARSFIDSFSRERDRYDERVADLESRISSLAHARERLFAGSVRASEIRADLERVAANRAKTIDQMTTAHAIERAEFEQSVKRLETQNAKLEYDLDGLRVRSAATATDYERLKVRAKQVEEELKRANAGLAHAAEVVRSLSLAHRQATESLASLELVRVRLEYDLATRVGAAESQTSRFALAASRLREDRTLLIETIALRERRIAILEATIREIATDMIRVAEAERDRYVAMNHALVSSKIVKIRDVVRRILRRPLELRARLLVGTGRSAPKRRTPRLAGKRPRHLRSA